MNKFCLIISTFTKKEKEDFKLFLNSPYFKIPQDLIQLGEYFLHLPAKTSPSKKQVWQSIYPHQPFSDEVYRKRISKLSTLPEQF